MVPSRAGIPEGSTDAEVRLEPPPAVRWIARTLEDAGFETWAVGGAIRDAILGHGSADWDLATRARPTSVRALFRRTVPIGVEHGTVGVLARDGVMYEVTTFRKDVTTDGRHAVVEFAERIEDDLSRRDFTINAIAWHPIHGRLFDPFGGAADLRRGRLRTVGHPGDRFREDYLRILRALRFAARFDLEIEAETWVALGALVDHLTVLSPERVREELLKVLADDPRPSGALELYAASGALAVLYPELEALRNAGADVGAPGDAAERAPGEAWRLSLAAIDVLPRARATLRLAALLSPLPAESVAAILLRLRCSNVMIEDVARLSGVDPLPAAGTPPVASRMWLARHGPGRITAAARLELARARAECALGGPDRCRAVVAAWRHVKGIARERPPIAVGDLAIDGRDLISLGLRPGPHFGRILDDLLGWVLEDPSRNERARLLERASAVAAGLARDADAGAGA